LRKAGFAIGLLASADCGHAGGGTAPNSQELAIFDLWDSIGMNKSDFDGGTLVAFLKKLRHKI